MSTATRVFRWSEMYSVNIAALDRQHQELFESINELEVALRAGEGDRSVEEVLAKLVNYAAAHFAAEESLMEQHGFPGFSSHRAQHEMFRNKLGDLLAKHRESKRGV